MNWTEEQYAEYLQRRGIEPPEQKKSKYHNNRVIVDGIHFDSQLEADKYLDLKLQLRMGTIAGYCRQPEFILVEGLGMEKPVTYRADFVVFNNDGTYEIIDTKGFETQEFKRTKKLFRAKFPKLELKVERRDDG